MQAFEPDNGAARLAETHWIFESSVPVSRIHGMDEVLVTLNPAINVADFVLAAKLHRRLEHVQAWLAATRIADPIDVISFTPSTTFENNRWSH